MRVFRLLLIFIALILLGLDIYMSHRGLSVCPYEGCKIVAQTPFASLCGYPLTYWGIAFFLVALVLLFSEALFVLWMALGTGFSLYMVYLQVSVIDRLCQMCLLIEGVVFVLFLSALSAKHLKERTFLVVLLGFLATHALYTFPPSYRDVSVDKAATFSGSGLIEAVFFFDPLCPACERAYKILREHRNLFSSIYFRSVSVHKGSMKRARLFYSLCYKGVDPFEAFLRIHGKKVEDRGCKLLPYPKIKGIVEDNLKGLLALGIDAVPVIVVKENGKRKIFVGYKELGEWLASVSQPPAPQLFVPLEGGICTPNRCD